MGDWLTWSPTVASAHAASVSQDASGRASVFSDGGVNQRRRVRPFVGLGGNGM